MMWDRGICIDIIDISIATHKVVVEYKTAGAVPVIRCYDITSTFIPAIIDFLKSAVRNDDLLHTVIINMTSESLREFHEVVGKLSLEKAHEHIGSITPGLIKKELLLLQQETKSKKGCNIL